jgi:hypothetical protein
LLEDVLAGEAAGGFREASLVTVLGLARRRRRIRAFRRFGVVAATLLVATIAGTRYFSSKPTKPEVAQIHPPAASFNLVTTQPLSAAKIVTSRPLSPAQIVSSLQMSGIVSTVSGNYREVGDEELLALAAPQIVALVRRGPHEVELVFVSATAEQTDN